MENEQESPVETYDFSAILLKLKQGFEVYRPCYDGSIKAYLPEPGDPEHLPRLYWVDNEIEDYEPDQDDLFATDWMLGSPD